MDGLRASGCPSLGLSLLICKLGELGRRELGIAFREDDPPGGGARGLGLRLRLLGVYLGVSRVRETLGTRCPLQRTRTVLPRSPGPSAAAAPRAERLQLARAWVTSSARAAPSSLPPCPPFEGETEAVRGEATAKVTARAGWSRQEGRRAERPPWPAAFCSGPWLLSPRRPLLAPGRPDALGPRPLRARRGDGARSAAAGGPAR